jgi:hypothetical protein
MAGVERLDHPLDGATLAGGIPALEHDADRRAELAAGELTAVDEPEVEEAELRFLQSTGFLILGNAQGEIDVLQPWISISVTVMVVFRRPVFMLVLVVAVLVFCALRFHRHGAY